MTCGEVREYLFAFLDNEVESGLSMEIQRHLERCADCAREMEIERAIRRHLALALEQGAPKPDLDLREWRLDPGVTHVRRRLRGRRGWAAAITLAALVLGTGWWWTTRTGSPQAGRHGIAEILIDDFQHFLTEGRPLQVTSSDHEAVGAWLREQTGLDVTLPRLSGATCRLVGARRCRIQDRSAGFVLYEMHGQPASLIILPNGDIEMQAMQRVEHDGRTHWRDQFHAHTVVLCRRGALVYAAVSTLPEKELVHLMTGPGHESPSAGS